MRLNWLFPASVLVLIIPLAVVACGGGSGGSVVPGSDAGAAAVVDVAASEALGYIPSPRAGEHMGEVGTVRGSVKPTTTSAAPKAGPTFSYLTNRASSKGEQHLVT